MMTSPTTLAVAGCCALASFFGTMNLLPEYEQRVLTLARFDYDAGVWTQQVVSESGKAITGDWTVQISRSENGALTVLCDGGGRGIYNGSVNKYVTDEWVGSACPDLLPHDIAVVNWEYVNHHGIKTSLSATYVIPDP